MAQAGGIVMILGVATLFLGGVATGIENAVDEGLKNSSGSSILILNCVFVLGGAILLWMLFAANDRSSLSESIEDIFGIKTNDTIMGMVTVSQSLVLMYLVKVGLIFTFELPYAHQWITPLYSLLLLLIFPLAVFLFLDFGLGHGRDTKQFFENLFGLVLLLLETVLKWVLSPYRLLLNLTCKGRYLHDKVAQSTNYELAPLLASSEWHKIYFLSGQNEFLMIKFADCGSSKELIRISSDGVITHRVLNLPVVQKNGICFGENHYYDWIFTADSTPRSYIKKIKLSQTSKDECRKLLEQSTEIVLNEGNSDDPVYCYLKLDAGWMLLEGKLRDDEEDSKKSKNNHSHFDKKEFVDLVSSTYPSKTKSVLTELIRPKAEDKHNHVIDPSIHIDKFVRTSHMSEIYRSIHYLDWHGWYGTGVLRLNHESEQIIFKAFVNKNVQGYETDVAFLGMPDIVKQQSTLRFLWVSPGKSGKRSNDRSGLYVLRPRAVNADATKGFDREYHWAPVIKFLPTAGKLNSIMYCNGESETFNSGLSSPVRARARKLPSQIRFYWKRSILKNEFLRIYCNARSYFWSRIDHPVFGIRCTINLDAHETALAFEQLSSGEDVMRLEVVLERSIEERQREDYYLSICLTNGKRAIPLRLAVLDASGQSRDDEKYRDRDELIKANYSDRYLLKAVYEKAMEDPEALPAFIEAAAFVIPRVPLADEETASDMRLSFCFTKLLYRYTLRKAYPLARAVLQQYIDQWLPVVGVDKYTNHIAAEGLAIALLSRDDALAAQVFEKILGPDFDFSKLDNESHLLFNLACYYAVHHDKDKMLTYTRQAVRHGKDPDRFRHDEDFKEYLQDAEFQKALQEPALTEVIKEKD